jgi:2-polyprenyl-3-methyl-5-hydroxy-6-metoxy-1,4-benzoquinol methylase
MDDNLLERGVMALKWEANYRKRFSGDETVSKCFIAVPDTVDEDIYQVFDQINMPGCSVLDIGTGIGEHAILLAQKGYNVTGIDISASAIAHAQKNAIENNVNVNFIVDNILSSDLKNQYDVLVDRGCYELIAIENLEIYLANMMKLLKPGGWYILKTARRRRRVNAIKNTSGLTIVKLKDTVYKTLDNRTIKARLLVAKKA